MMVPCEKSRSCPQWRICCLFVLYACIAGFCYGKDIRRSSWEGNKTLPPLSGPACRITQYSNKHVGHQLEGKLSCSLLSLIEPERFKYFHTPFKHVGEMAGAAEVERFFRLTQERPHSKFSTTLLEARENKRVMLDNMMVFNSDQQQAFNAKVRQGASPCEEDKEYVMDNCMELLYDEPFVSKLRTGQTELLGQYLQESKPDVGFTAYNQTYNVVLYIRSEDARLEDVEIFYEWAIMYFLAKYPPNSVRVWVESDVSYLPQFPYWNAKFGYCLTLPNKNGMDFFKTFHRLVMADGLIYFPSNLVMAATLLNNRTDTIIVPILDTKTDNNIHTRFVQHRQDWFQQVDAVRKRTVGQLGFVSNGLVNMKQPVDNVAPCPLTQYGTDGFGHQLEGKLSCALLALIWPARFHYSHIPFVSIEHMTAKLSNATEAAAMAAAAETFVNLGSLFLPFDGVVDPKRGNPSLGSNRLTKFVGEVTKVIPKCEQNHTYMVDNCWELTYRPPTLQQIDSVRPILREAYLKTPKPDTGFIVSNFTRNVVVHMRNGDAQLQHRFRGLNESRFFMEGMHYYIRKFNRQAQTPPMTVHFWIETDSPTWEPVTLVQKAFSSTPGVVLHMAEPNTPILTAFHRMVMADGLVMSPSSFSNSAAILSQADELVITSGDHGVHTFWMDTNRFVKIK